MQKVEGSSPFSRLIRNPRLCGGFVVLEVGVRAHSFIDLRTARAAKRREEHRLDRERAARRAKDRPADGTE
jgi:hypothetical protein